MTIVDLGHPALACADLDASLAFYARLGLPESFRILHDDGSVMLCYLQIGHGDRFLELFPGGPTAADRADDAHQSFRHICLTVSDLLAMVAELRANGITIDVEPQRGLDHNLQAWIHDPDGNKIELMELSPRSPQVAIANGTAFPASEVLIKAEG